MITYRLHQAGPPKKAKKRRSFVIPRRLSLIAEFQPNGLAAVVLYRDFGLTEMIFVAPFALLYLLYLSRVIRIARQLNTPFHAVFIKVFLRTAMFGLLIVALL